MLTTLQRSILALMLPLYVGPSLGSAQSLVEKPEVKVIEEPTYTVYMRYYEKGKVTVYARVYKDTSRPGGIIHNSIHIQDEEKNFLGGLIVEEVHADRYIVSIFNRVPTYSMTVERFPNGMEAIIVYRNSDSKIVAIIEKKKSGEWDTDYNKELHDLVRKYHKDMID